MNFVMSNVQHTRYFRCTNTSFNMYNILRVISTVNILV